MPTAIYGIFIENKLRSLIFQLRDRFVKSFWINVNVDFSKVRREILIRNKVDGDPWNIN